MINSATRFLPGAAVGLAMMTGAAQAQYIKLGHPVAWQESGQASWYGDWHNGRRTASGEIFNQNALTAAHPSLPLGSRVSPRPRGRPHTRHAGQAAAAGLQ